MSDSLTGNLLVASSLANDPNYALGVCLIMHQDEEHTIGVMLNRPLKPTPEALRAMFGGDSSESIPAEANRLGSAERPRVDDDSFPKGEALPAADSEQTPLEEVSTEKGGGIYEGAKALSPWRMVHVGGPLSGPVVALHQDSQFAEAEPGDGIYVAAQRQYLEDLVRQPVAPYRLIVGHLGWKTDDLEGEIEAGVWHVVPATAETVFSPASDMWPHLIRRATSNSLAKWIGVPDNVYAYELN